MCLPACTIQMARRVSRRSFLANSAAGAAAASVVLSDSAVPAEELRRVSFRSVVDLTHTLGPSFPFPVERPFELERISTRGKEMWNINRWHFHEHIGTHLDAPFHCSDGDTAEQI